MIVNELCPDQEASSVMTSWVAITQADTKIIELRPRPLAKCSLSSWSGFASGARVTPSF
jgi:hypothetical protein